MRRNAGFSRRSMSPSKENDYSYLLIKTSNLCRGLAFCEGKLEPFLNEYVSDMTNAVKSVLEVVIHPEPKPDLENITSNAFFNEELNACLREIRKLLRTADMVVTGKTESYYWTDLIKKISSMFQESGISVGLEKIENNHGDLTEIKKTLTQKFVIATVVIEGKYESRICSEHGICTKSFECTKALSTLLGAFPDLDGEKVKGFMRIVSESLLETTFYSHLSETTSNELQVILNDMAYSDSVPTKEVLHTVHKTVDERLGEVQVNAHQTGGKDVELLHVILSDMDHIYAKRKVDPFHVFLSNFFEWTTMDTKLRSYVRDVMKEIGDQLYEVSEQLQVKVIREVKAFLELTIDPEN
ncbi:uncharacterized protein LOC142978674 isoform X2 [Anticarsia gemmatalis]